MISSTKKWLVRSDAGLQEHQHKCMKHDHCVYEENINLYHSCLFGQHSSSNHAGRSAFHRLLLLQWNMWNVDPISWFFPPSSRSPVQGSFWRAGEEMSVYVRWTTRTHYVEERFCSWEDFSKRRLVYVIKIQTMQKPKEQEWRLAFHESPVQSLYSSAGRA